jgi:hypothetical protein
LLATSFIEATIHLVGFSAIIVTIQRCSVTEPAIAKFVLSKSQLRCCEVPAEPDEYSFGFG